MSDKNPDFQIVKVMEDSAKLVSVDDKNAAQRLKEVLSIMFSKEDMELSKNLMFIGYYSYMTASESYTCSEMSYEFLTKDNRQFSVCVAIKHFNACTEFKYKNLTIRKDFCYSHIQCSTTYLSEFREHIRSLIKNCDGVENRS